MSDKKPNDEKTSGKKDAPRPTRSPMPRKRVVSDTKGAALSLGYIDGRVRQSAPTGGKTGVVHPPEKKSESRKGSSSVIKKPSTDAEEG